MLLSIKGSLIYFFIIFISTQSICQNMWLGGNGDYDDPDEWSYGMVPTANDDVQISGGTVNLPPNGDYYAKSIEITNDAVINFQGDTDGGRIHIYKDLFIETTVTTQYEANSFARWIFEGTTTNHIIDAKNIELNYVHLDEQSSQIELASSIITSNIFRIQNGSLDTNNNPIETGVFRVGGGCSGANCLPKTINLGSSNITCINEWNAEFNYGSVTMLGSYEISTPIFKGGIDIDYHDVVLSDYDSPSTSDLFAHNMVSRNNTFNNLTIDNIHRTKIAGDITVNGLFKVIHQNSDIIITKEANSETEQWTFLGSIDLPEDQGGCYDFTHFITSHVLSQEFTFHTDNSNLVFDWAIINGVATSGGGTFTINNGYVAGYNSGWIIGEQITSKSLYWIGGTGEWNDGNHWSLNSGGSAYGCPPSIIDNAIFDEKSFNSSTQTVSIVYGEKNFCKDFIWKSMTESAKFIDISTGIINHPDLQIAGKVDIDMPDIFDFDGADLILISNDEVSLNSASPLPFCVFNSNSSGYLQTGDITYDRGLLYRAGYYETEGNNIQCNGNLFCESEQIKVFTLSDSEINISGIANFGDLQDGNVIVNAGTSHIICNEFSSVTNNFNIVEVNGTEPFFINPNGPNIYIRKFILNGGSISIFLSGLDTDSLVLNSNTAGLELHGGYTSNIYKDLVSNVISGAAPKITNAAVSSQAKINFPRFQTCISGLIEFEDVEAISPSPVNTPNGVNGGNNTNFDFTPTPLYTGTLYWIGGDGELKEQFNWSTGSGACPSSINSSSADQLIIDSNSFEDDEDTIRVSTLTNVQKLKFLDVGHATNLHLTNNLNIEELEVDNTLLYHTSPTQRNLTIDHHAHIKNNGAYVVSSSTVLAGSKSATLDEITLHVEANSLFIAQNCNLFLRGQSSDLSQPTLKFEPTSNIVAHSSDLYIFPPNSGQPIRDITIEANNAEFDLLSVSLSSSVNQDLIIKENLRCKSISVGASLGNVIIKNGTTLQVKE